MNRVLLIFSNKIFVVMTYLIVKIFLAKIQIIFVNLVWEKNVLNNVINGKVITQKNTIITF